MEAATYGCQKRGDVEEIDQLAEREILSYFIGKQMEESGDSISLVENFGRVVSKVSERPEYTVLIPESMDAEDYEDSLYAMLEGEEPDTYQAIRGNIWDDKRSWGKAVGGGILFFGGIGYSLYEGQVANAEAIFGGGLALVDGWLLELHQEYGPEDFVDGVKTLATEQRLPTPERYEEAKQKVREQLYAEEKDIDIGRISQEIDERGINILRDRDLDADDLELIETALEQGIDGCKLVEIGMEPRVEHPDEAGISLRGFLDRMRGGREGPQTPA